MIGSPPGEHPTVARLRRGLLGLAGLGVIGTAAELAIIRHWDNATQLIPWAAVAVLTAALLAVAIRPSRGRVRAARLLAAGSAAAGLYGIYDHVAANYHAAPLDRVYGPRWDAMRLAARWWAASTGEVGPAPTLAPAMLAQIGLCLMLATLAHPVLRAGAGAPPSRYREPVPPDPEGSSEDHDQHPRGRVQRSSEPSGRRPVPDGGCRPATPRRRRGWRPDLPGRPAAPRKLLKPTDNRFEEVSGRSGGDPPRRGLAVGQGFQQVFRRLTARPADQGA